MSAQSVTELQQAHMPFEFTRMQHCAAGLNLLVLVVRADLSTIAVLPSCQTLAPGTTQCPCMHGPAGVDGKHLWVRHSVCNQEGLVLGSTQSWGLPTMPSLPFQQYRKYRGPSPPVCNSALQSDMNNCVVRALCVYCSSCCRELG